VNRTVDIPVQAKINVETARAQAAEDALDNTKIDKSIAGEAGTLLQAITIKEDDASTVIVTGWSCNVNEASDPIPNDIPLPIVDETKAGIAPAGLFNQVLTNTQELTILKNDAVAVELSSETPTQDELNDAYTTAAGQPVTNGAALFDITYQIRYGYYGNISQWVKTSGSGGGTTVSIATNNSLGIVKGSASDGQCFVETDGTQSLNGYDDIIADISNLQTGKVDKVSGKGLSANDYTDAEKAKLAAVSPNSGYNLLDYKSTDHILEDDEAVGWTLQGQIIDKENCEQALDIIEYDFNRATLQNIIFTLSNINNVLVTATIELYKVPNGRLIATPDNFSLVEDLFTQTGSAWIYKYDPDTDPDNPTLQLPRNNNYFSYTDNNIYVNNYQFDRIVDITGEIKGDPALGLNQFLGDYGSINPNTAGTGCFNITTATRRGIGDAGSSITAPDKILFNSANVTNSGDRVLTRSVQQLLYFRTS
jgi:hypothetical protein